MSWINVNDQLPQENQTVWACNSKTKYVNLMCLVYDEDGWLWAETNGVIFSENGFIVSECELDDDYDITHWHPLPKLPIE